MDLNSLLIAIATATSMHRMAEPGSINYKLRRLSKAVSTGAIETPPLKGINTRPKAYALGLAALFGFTAIGYLVASLFDPSTRTAIIYSIIVLLAADVLSMVAIDKYHADIEVLLKK